MFDRDGWACRSGTGRDCVCQLIAVNPLRCGPDAIPSSERLSHRRRWVSSEERLEKSSRGMSNVKVRSVRQKKEDMLPYQCLKGLRCAIVNPNRTFAEHECVSCNTHIPGIKYQLNDTKNCDEKTLDPIDGRRTALLQPCSPTNGSTVCDDDLECFSFQPFRAVEYRLRPCTESTITKRSIGCFCQVPDTVVNGDTCKQSSDCSVGYRCGSVDSVSVCVSCQADKDMVTFVDDGKAFCEAVTTSAEPEVTGSTSPSPSPAPPCIAVDALRQFKSSDLVFAQHIRTTVLCDVHGNCATPGHIVMHKLKPMMMKTYCGLSDIECRYKIKFVNSPRMKFGMRIPSNSNEFMYTALSARHESLIEEYILAAIIRVNF